MILSVKALTAGLLIIATAQIDPTPVTHQMAAPTLSWVWAVARRGSVSLDIPFHKSVNRKLEHLRGKRFRTGQR
jgi:hypothetical protein